MSNSSKKTQQGQTLFTLMDSQLKNTQPYTDLSNFLSSLRKHQTNYTPEEFGEAQNLTNRLVESVCQFLLGKADSDVLQLLQQSLSLYPAQSSKNSKRQEDPLSPHGALNRQINDFDSENNLNDSEHNDDDIIDRIAEQLKIRTPTTEEELVETISNKLNQAEQLKSNLIKSFKLPKNTQNDDIVNALNEKFGNNQYDSSDEKLRIQLSQLSKELTNAHKQMHSLRSNEEQKNLTILELQNKIAELQNTEIMNDISAEIVDHKIDIARYKAEMATLKSENAKLIKFKTKSQKKNAELQRILKGYQEKSKALAQKNEDLQKEISDQKEKEQLDDLQSNSDTDKKDDLQFPFDQLLDQYEKQSKEIYEESALRMELLDSVQKLMSINTILDQKLHQATARVNELENIRDNMFKEQAEIKQQLMSRSIGGNLNDDDNGLNSDNQNGESSISDDYKEVVDDSLIEHLKEIIQPANDSLRDTLSGIVENPDFTISKRVLSLVSTLVNSIQHSESYDENPEVLEQRNQLLLSTVGSLMQFFNDMIRSQEIRSWAFTQYSFEESKSLLMSQVQAIQQFMKENCIQYLEDENTILSSFVERNDPLQLEQSVKRILIPYEKVRTNEGKDLLILLQQSLAAGLLLQAYATQVTQQWSTQDDEKKELQARIDELEKANEQYADELREEIEKTQQDIERYRQSQNQKAQLQISYTNEDDQNVATSTIDSSLVSQSADDDYVKKLEEKLNKNQKKLEKYKNSVQSLKSILRAEVEKGNLSNSVLDNLKNLENVEPISDDQYIHNLEAALQKYESGNGQNENKEKSTNLNEDDDDKNLNEKTETNLKDTDVTEVHPKDSGDKEKIEALTEENNHLKEQLNKIRQKLAIMQDAFKKSHASMKQKHKKMKQALVQQSKDLAKSLEKSAQKQEEAEKKCKEAVQELADVKQKNRQLQIDNKLANAKLISRNEEIKREKSIADSQWKLRQYNLEASTQNQIDKHRREVDEQLSRFLISVCQLFRKYVDVNQTINCDNVLSILSDVADKLDKYTKQAYEFEKVNDVINFRSGEDPSKRIDQLVKENRKLTSQVRSLSSENGELKKKIKTKDDAIISRAPAKDWEEWAIPLYRKVTNSKATKPTSYILRKGIENALQQAINNNKENDNVQAPSNWTNTNSYDNNDNQNENVSIFHLTILAVAAIRLQKMIHSFKSNQDLSKTKFKASETHFSGPPVTQKFSRNPYETQNEM